MRLYLLFILFPVWGYCQKQCSGIVLDKITGKAIPYATIALIKENKGVSASELGIFSITSSFPTIDSLNISCVGYKPIRIAVENWTKDSTSAILEQQIGQLETIAIGSKLHKQSYLVNAFNLCSAHWFQIGSKTIYQLAQRFDAPEKYMQLKNVQLCKDPSASIFRIRIYDLNPLNNSPSIDLADTVIEVRSSDKLINLNVENYNIIIPNKQFFVAIEWLFIPFNEEKEKIKINGIKSIHTLYKPFPRLMTNNKFDKEHLWQLSFNGNWELIKKRENYNFQITVELQ